MNHKIQYNCLFADVITEKNMLNQKTFSILIQKFLQEEFPEFLPSVNYLPDNSFDCSLKSLSESFSIWIATYNSEITIGIEDPNGNSDIHTHISFHEMEDLEDSLNTLSKMIREIIGNEIIVYQNQDGKYGWATESEFLKTECSKIFYWDKN